MKALVLGSTGLVGNELIRLLIEDKEVTEIHTIGRKNPSVSSEKVKMHLIDLENIESIADMDVDVLFIAFGTTIKTAGSKLNQERIDVEIPTHIMNLSKKIGVKTCVLVSALGVSEKSSFFYSRMKARLDRNANEINFDHLILVKPSVLDGDRKEKRTGEKLSIFLGNLIGKTGLINLYKPVKAKFVAATMIDAAKNPQEKIREIDSAQIHLIARRYFKE